MKVKRFGIKICLAGVFLASAVILLFFSLSISKLPGNTEREAGKVSRAVSDRMHILDDYIGSALTADRRVWAGHNNVPSDMVIYRYIEDTLQSWSNQFPVRNDDIASRIVFPRLSKPGESINSPLAEVIQEPSFANYGQKWYLVKSESLGSRKVIAGLEIVDSMSEDSPNGVNSKLGLGRGYMIVPLSESSGSAVTFDGKPVFKIMSSPVSGQPAATHSTMIWLAIICFITASLLHLAEKKSMKRLLLVLGGLMAVIAATYFWGENMKNSSRLFSPTVYADGQLFNSLGTVLITVLLIILCIGCTFVTRNDIFRRILKTRRVKLSLWIYAIFVLLLTTGVLVFVHVIFRSVILNSNISLELYRLNDLNIFSLLVYLMLTGLLMTVPLLTQMLMPALKRLFGIRHDLFSAGGRTVTAVIFASFMVIMAGTLGFRKEQNRVNVWANRLSIERDISLELELRRVEDKIASDQLIGTLSAIQNSNGIILNRIIESYMPMAAQDYDIAVELFPESVRDKGAIAYFTEMVSRGKTISDGSRFRYMRDAGGHSLYAGSFAYYNYGSGVTMMLMRVSPKSNRENRGYARLLGYSAPGDVLIPARYSYAKYSGKVLTSYKGNYSYPTIVDEDLEHEIDEAVDGVVRMNGYTHFVNKISDDDLIIVSRPKTEDFSYIVAFLFLTLVFYFCLTLMTLTRVHPRHRESNYYKSRINAAMLLALIMTLITLAGVSVLFVYRRNSANLKSSMADKVNSLQTLLQARCRYVQDFSDFSSQEASMILEDISNTMKSDITLYTTNGKEFRSTTPEVFDRMLLGSRMNPDAFESIIYKNKRYYIGKEYIGARPTYFLYAPVFNAQGKMIAIMCSPFTDESFDFKSEAVLHSISVVTVFMILLLLARFIMATAVDKMFKPLSEMGRKMNEASINNLEYIVYERDDEVARLVRAYNLMVHDLYNSTRKLTQAERDKAWATMARQVAHEIKNPLTPIKLQIQRLVRMKSNGNPAWADRFDEISVEVLKQIDLLADTANEFSTFAKLYTEEPVEINLDNLLKEEIDLFDSRDNIRFSYMGLDNASVMGPKPQLTRVFVNLINNAVQAIENAQAETEEKGLEPFQGRIVVSLRLSSKDGFYDIVFEDNGPGVSEENRSKLFTPNFTTKSNGTGLGLSICRNILEKCNGEIFYSKSFTLKGACFTVRFPRK